MLCCSESYILRIASEETIDRVINELKSNGIEPEQSFLATEENNLTTEIDNIKIRAEQIRTEWELQEKELQEQAKLNFNNALSSSQISL